MLGSYFNLPVLTIALCAAMVQTAPSQEALMAIYRVDPMGLVSRDNALADNQALVSKVELPLPQDLFEQNDANEMQMHLLQLNLLKILIILDVIILLFVFHSMNSD